MAACRRRVQGAREVRGVARRVCVARQARRTEEAVLPRIVDDVMVTVAELYALMPPPVCPQRRPAHARHAVGGGARWQRVGGASHARHAVGGLR